MASRSGAAAGTSGSYRRRFSRRDERRFYLFVLPWLVGVAAFQLGPMLVAMALSLTDWQLITPPEWRGIDHFRHMPFDPQFRHALRNTLYYSAGSVPLGLASSFGLAMLLNRRWAGMAVFRTIFFLPALISGVAMTLVWGWLFNPRFGAINGLLGALGLPRPGWLTDPNWAMPAIVLLSLWGVGGTMLVYLAGLQNVPRDLYDAARIDGANRWNLALHVTLPMVSPVTFFLLVVGTIGSLQLFTPMYVLTNGGPKDATLTLPLYIYQNAFSYQEIGYAAALTVVAIAITMLLTLVQLAFARRWVFYSGWGYR